MPADVSRTLWKIHTKSNGTLTSGFALNSISEVDTQTRGDTGTFELHFTDEPLIIESGETHTINSGDTEIYTYVDIKQNGTLNNNGTLIETGANGYLETIQEYADHAGSFASSSTLNNTQLFREQIPDTADVDSLLLGVEPNQSLKDRGVNGVWGLITSGSDSRTSALTNPVFTLEVQILAEYADYADHTAVENDLLV